MANDLRMRDLHSSPCRILSLRYYDTHQSGVLPSTITADVLTIQNFASSATLGIVVDMFTILGMLVVMFFLELGLHSGRSPRSRPCCLCWRPGSRRRSRASTHEVRQQSNIVAVVQQDLESIRVVTAFGRQELEQEELAAVSQATVAAALKARQVKALLAHRFDHRFLLRRLPYFGAALCSSSGGMTAGELTVFSPTWLLFSNR